jgi:3-oxoacyl-[acyl-carrier protein] reductase
MSKTIVVTGSRKGIGKRISENYLERGYNVIGFSRGESSLNKDHYEHYRVDVTKEDKVSSVVKRVESEHGPIYGLINNAGMASMNHISLTPGSSSRKVFDVNFHGLFFMLREVSKRMMRNGGGRIINMSTVAAPLELEGEAIYSSSKAAVEQLTKVASKELADYGITVNAVGPTPIKTDLIKGVSESKIKDLIARQAIERYAEVSDVENVIDFFLDDESDFVTGQVIYLGGVTD